jgi:hypothetical protein
MAVKLKSFPRANGNSAARLRQNRARLMSWLTIPKNSGVGAIG